jgi:glutamyl-tRNA synthetase
MSASRVRVRYAPSPTGEPHVGNIRTAIFDWLFARHHGGVFIIRIEDTDQARKVEGGVELQLEALKWLGLEWDEGPDVGGPHSPYTQSERLAIYHQAADQLIERGAAYRCYCSPERLEELRKEQARLRQPTGYDRRCRDLSEGERLELEAKVGAGFKPAPTPVVRFKMPLDGVTTVNDLIRGEVSFENRLVDDFVILKSDGFPTYHLAAQVDDHYMEISHVFRGEEWLPSFPRHVQLYKALGWEPPLFAHLPIILAPDRSKLSKRHGATSVLEYRQMGYLPEAMVNFLTLLGWSLDDKTEIISIPDLIRHFGVERLSRVAAVFDIEKLNWMNGQYIRQSSHERLADALLDYWGRYPPEEITVLPARDYLLRIVPLIQERIKTLRDAAPLIPFFFRDVEYDSDKLIQKGMDAAGTRRALEVTLAELSGLAPFDAGAIEGRLRPLAQELNLKPGQLFGALRIATTGLDVSPPLFHTMEVLGRERTLAAIQRAVDRLSRP